MIFIQFKLCQHSLKKRKEKEPTDGAQDKKNIYVTNRIKIRSNSEFWRIVDVVQAGDGIGVPSIQ